MGKIASFLLATYYLPEEQGIHPAASIKDLMPLRRLCDAFAKAVRDVPEGTMQAMDQLVTLHNSPPSSREEALRCLEMFLFLSHRRSLADNLRFAATREDDKAAYFTEGYLYPAAARVSACAMVKVSLEPVVAGHAKKGQTHRVVLTACIKNPTDFADNHGLQGDDHLLRFKNDKHQQWAPRIYVAALAKLRECGGEDAPFEVPPEQSRKVATLLLYREFRKDNKLSVLQAYYAALGFEVNETNARRTYEPMGIEPSPDTGPPIDEPVAPPAKRAVAKKAAPTRAVVKRAVAKKAVAKNPPARKKPAKKAAARPAKKKPRSRRAR